jgi:hypothetical protein
MSENPFERLQLDPAGTEEEVVRAAALLRRRAADEAALNAVRQAVQALTAHPEERLLHALLAHPQPAYRWPALERLAAAFRRPPAGEAPPGPPLDMSEFTDLLLAVVAQELEPAALPLEAPGEGESAEEVRRQAAEALWQGLPADMRA